MRVSTMMKRAQVGMAVVAAAAGLERSATAQSSSILAQDAPAPSAAATSGQRAEPSAAQQEFDSMSLFAVMPEPPQTFVEHDLISIIVRESTSSKTKHEMSTSKDWELGGEVKDFPQLTINDFLEGILKGSENANAPKLDITGEKSFEGSGELKTSDDFTTRIQAEVIEVLPNGQIVIEARTRISRNDEIQTVLLSGRCDPRDVTSARTVLSSQLFDLQITMNKEGELQKTNEKGFIARVLETIFAF